jgi:hypothetical protein
MNTASGYCEVVWIMDRNRLVDAESYERTYAWDGKHPPASGYYVAHWPSGTTNPHFLHDGLRFAGPYGSRRAAEKAAAERIANRQRAASVAEACSPCGVD